MIRFFLYLLLFGVVLFLLSAWSRRKGSGTGTAADPSSRSVLRPKPNSQEVWFQVYETDTLDEARRLQARIQEEEVECIIYEQGKKGIHGNEPRGIGIAVPKTAMRLAQGIISRMLSP